ncbi:BON domain-containing protein [Azohydromonas aeria]|uniref:BON domain-containing protein n=1 Tax=Azohydromonas aeria TaxID=2590212 RepID=UPI0012F8D624|nr:BON domain-containing protein [Azohydromonas aeria]
MNRTWTVLGTLAAGAAALYLTDAEQGARRRSALRRTLTRAAREAADTLEDTGREALDRLQQLDHQGRQAGDQAAHRLQRLADEGRQAGRRAWHRAEALAREARDPVPARHGSEHWPVQAAPSGGGRPWLPMLGGIAIGVAAMYLLEPQHRSRRLALVRDQALRLGRSGADLVGVDPQDLGERARGLAARAAGLLQGTPPDDAVLEQRVRGALQRVLSDAQALRITADAGCVSLGGPVPADELARLFECAASVRGVSQVRDDGLQVQPSATAAAALRRQAAADGAPASPLQA